MAYSAVISVQTTIERLLTSTHILIVASSREILEFAYKELKSLPETFRRLDSSSKGSSRKRENSLDGQIREAACNLEDLLESHLSNQVISQSETIGDRIQLTIDLQDLRQDVNSIVKKTKMMEEEYLKELDNEDEENEAISPSTRTFCGKKSKLVGLSDLFVNIMALLTQRNYLGFPVISLVGMGGIGKTTLAEEIYEHPDVLECFDCRVWVTVGRKCQLNEVARAILAQVDPGMDKMVNKWDEEITQYLYEAFKGKKYLIVLDDVWDLQVWECLENAFPREIDEGSRVLLTTRLHEVYDAYLFERSVRFLNKKESWDLFCEKVFGGESCPLKLEKAGIKIVEKCDGLPLMIVTVAGLLSKAGKTPEYWNGVAEKQNSLFRDAYDEISEVLFPSYQYLPQHLKPCFLHMGVFPQKFEIPRSNIFNFWVAEGFLNPNTKQTLEECANKYFKELNSNSLMVIHQKSTITPARNIKTCSLHSSLWHLCNKEAENIKFFHVLNNCSLEGVKRQRTLCFHNILLGVEDVYNSVVDECASTARSLLCFGSYNKYPVPICSELRLLRVLDALKIRLYEFPTQVLKLVQLRYLALTCDGSLPTSISKLWNLQFLIIHRHLSIALCDAQTSYVPIEIWDMKELKHIQIMGSNLPKSNGGASLKNLSTLLGVSAHSCSKGVLRRILNLKKLGIHIELVPDDDSMPFRCLNRIHRLHQLISLKCVLVNPELRSEVFALPAPRSMFPSSLQKLHLSGLGYPWEYMDIIGSLPNLQVLKLRHYAFRGPTWEIGEIKFPKLRFLAIEDSDLVQWKVGSGSFSRLRHLTIKHCYELQEFHWEFHCYFKEVEVVDCNPLAAAFIHSIKSRQGLVFRDVRVHSSWDDGNLKL